MEIKNKILNDIAVLIDKHMYLTEKIESEKKWKELDIDSITYIQIIVSLEEKYRIEFAEDALANDYFATIQDMVNYIYDEINEI